MGKLKELGKKIASKSIKSSKASEMPSTEMKMEDRMSMMGPSMKGSPMAMKGSWMSKHCKK